MLMIWIALHAFLLWRPGHSLTDEKDTNIDDSSYSSEGLKSPLCKPKWYPFGGKCYKILGLGKFERLGWEEAVDKCFDGGGEIATVDSQELQDYITAFLLLNTTINVWIGLHDTINESTYSWRDGTPFNYTNWGPMEPSGIKDEKEDCVEMMFMPSGGQSGTWNDLDCDFKKPVLCQSNPDAQNGITDDPRLCSETSGGGWNLHGSCFHVHSANKTWKEAEEFCVTNYQGHLATISDITVEIFLETVLKEYKDHKLWIGIKVGTLPPRWSSGFLVSFMYLDDKDFRVEDFVNGTCVYLHQEQRWILDSCKRSLPFVCETSTAIPPQLTPAPEGAFCPKTPVVWWDLGGEYCYNFQKEESVSWYEASFECIRMGGNLISFHSQEEVDTVEQFLKHTVYVIHIGLYRQFDNEEHFAWLDGSSSNYSNWDEDEPNSVKELCVEFRANTMAWNDIDCEATRGYICMVNKILPSGSDAEIEDSCKSSLSAAAVVGVAFCMAFVTVLIGAVVYHFRKPDKEQVEARKTSVIQHVPPPAQRYRSGEIVIVDDAGYDNLTYDEITKPSPRVF